MLIMRKYFLMRVISVVTLIICERTRSQVMYDTCMIQDSHVVEGMTFSLPHIFPNPCFLFVSELNCTWLYISSHLSCILFWHLHWSYAIGNCEQVWLSGAVTLRLLWSSGYCGSPAAVACGLWCELDGWVPFTVQSHWKSSSFWLLSNGLSTGTDVPGMLGSVTFGAVEALIAMC